MKARTQRLLFRLFEKRRRRWLHGLDISTVLDIGANKGQFAGIARSLFPRAQIYAFEPIPDCFRALMRNFAKDANFAGFQVALGAHSEVATLHRSRYDQSSSLLEMADLHKVSFPYTAGSSSVQIQVRTLDEVCEGLSLRPELLVKIDVQGYEDRVIAGGTRVLTNAKVVVCEVSFAQLYEDQLLFDGIYEQMRKLGFTYQGSWSQLLSPLDGRVLQANAMFVRP